MKVGFTSGSVEEIPPMRADDKESENEAEEVEGEVEIVARIIRQPGTGLGMSIAGGLGSTPYKGTDKVRIDDVFVCGFV